MLKIQLWSQKYILFEQIFTYKSAIWNCNNISQYYVFCCILYEINAALVSRRIQTTTTTKNLLTPNFWPVVYFFVSILQYSVKVLIFNMNVAFLKILCMTYECAGSSGDSMYCRDVCVEVFKVDLQLLSLSLSVHFVWGCGKSLGGSGYFYSSSISHTLMPH